MTAVVYSGTTTNAASGGDSAGSSTYTEAVHIDNATVSTFRTYIYYQCNTGSGGGTTITVNYASAAASFLMITGDEYSGVSTSSCLDQIGSAQTTSNVTTLTSTTATTTQANELLIGGSGNWDGTTYTAGTDGNGGTYALRGNNGFVGQEEEIVSVTGTYDSNMTMTSTRPSILFASFFATSAAAQPGTVLAGPAKMAGPAVRHPLMFFMLPILVFLVWQRHL